MPANVNGMVKEAIRAYRAGKTDEAQALLLKATELDETNEQAWMWLSAVVDDIEDQIVCLENVLTINPDNTTAQRGLRILQKKQAGQGGSSGSGGTSDGESGGSTSPFAGIDQDELGDIDSDTSGFMSELDLGISDGTSDDLEEDDLESPPAQSAPQNQFEAAFEAADFDENYEDDFDDLESPDVAFDEFGDPFEQFERPGQGSQGVSAEGSDEPSAEDDFLLEDDLESPAETDNAEQAPAAADDDDMDSLLDELPAEDDAPSAATTQRTQTGQRTRNKAARFAEPEQAEVADSFDAYFRHLPDGIKPTRMPGVDEKYPPLLLIVLAMLVLANLAALALLLVNLT